MLTSRSLRFLFASGLLVAGAARAQLASVSPFVPPKTSPGAAAPTADAPLEFRGLAELPGGPAFRIVESGKKSGAWVRLNERDSDLGVTVKQHDAARETVTVEQNGRTFTLALRQSKVTSSGAPTPNAVVVPPQMQVPTIAAQMQAAAPANPIQQSQIDAVAAAVQQRRALRDQATQQMNQGVPIAPQVIQQQQQQRALNAGAPNQNGQNARGGRNGQNNQRQRQP